MANGQRVGAGFGVMIVRDGMILLGKRHDDPDKASSALRGEGTWTCPGGKLEFGESFEAGAIRETAEETGMRLTKVEVVCVNSDHNQHAHFVTVGLVAKEWEGEPRVMEPDEIVEWRWSPLDALPDPMFLPSAKMIRSFQEGKFSLAE